MIDQAVCPECSGPVDQEAGGFCPKCLLQLGLSAKSASAATTGTRFSSPDPEELSQRFPELEILEMVGQGGMGVVFKARQTDLDRLVALKILPPEVAQDPAFAERFQREARMLARLNHPNIVSVHDIGRREDLYYIVMEFVDGANLRDVIEAGTLGPHEALAIVPQICDALQYAHDEGVIHRDVKPENILLDLKGRAKIADFGLAKLLGRSVPDLALTETHQVMGTFHYMAPEQMESPTEVDHRADIFSLGVVLYELLTGQLPLGRFALPSERVPVDRRLDDVVLKTLERQPDHRYQHASEVKDQVETIANSPTPAKAPDKPPVVVAPAKPVAEPVRYPAPGPAPATSRPAPSVDAASGRLSARRAGTALIVLGMVTGILASIAILIMQIMTFVAIRFVPGHLELIPAYMLVSLLVIAPLIYGTLIAYGGIKLRDCVSLRWGYAASIMALLPLAVPAVLGIPFGIWGLVILGKKKVRQAFAEVHKTPNENHPRAVRRLFLGTGATGCALLLLALGAHFNAELIPHKVGTVLLYEVDYETGGSERDLLHAVNERLNPSRLKAARVRVLKTKGQKDRLEIGVYGSDPRRVNELEKRIASPATMSIRVLADKREDSERTVSTNGGPFATSTQWVRVAPEISDRFLSPWSRYDWAIKRVNEQGELEVQVLVDALEVDLDDIARIDTGRHTLRLWFDSEGAEKMRLLTSNPEYRKGFFDQRQLALIIDGELYTFSSINQTITDSMEIGVVTSQMDVIGTAAILRSGPLPARLSKLSRTEH